MLIGYTERSLAAPPSIIRVRDFLHEQMSGNVGLDELADLAGIDRFRWTRAFQRAFGTSPHAYLVHVRLQAAHRQALTRELTIVPYVEAMFSTGHDAANREVFRAEDAANLNFVGLALHGRKNAVDKAVKGLALHQ